MWHIHPVEYYAAIKRKEIPTGAITWINLRDIMPSAKSQTQKGKYYVVTLILST